MIGVQFKKLDERALPPLQAHPGEDAGWDLHVLEDTRIGPETIWQDVRSGIAIALPPGYYARLVARSSALRKKGVVVVEGIIDAGFRGELFTTVRPVGYGGAFLEAGSSICQIIVQEVRPVEFVEVEDLASSERGMHGFGSSGR